MMILLTRTCCCLPLRWGAIATFVFSVVSNLYPLYTLPEYIDKISVDIFLMVSSQIAFGVFVGVFAIIGTLKKRPHYIIPFLTYYLGLWMLDFLSVVFTFVLRQAFFAHNLLKGADLPAQRKGTRKQASINVFGPVVVFSTVLFLRSYFTFIVFSYYREMTDLMSESETSPEISEESLTPNMDNSTTKGSSKRPVYVLVNDT